MTWEGRGAVAKSWNRWREARAPRNKEKQSHGTVSELGGGRKEGWKRADVTRNDGARTVEKNESGGKARVEGRWWIGAPPSVAPSRGSLTPEPLSLGFSTTVCHPPRSGSRSQGWKSPAILLIVRGPRPTLPRPSPFSLYFPPSLSIFTLLLLPSLFISVPFSSSLAFLLLWWFFPVFSFLFFFSL